MRSVRLSLGAAPLAALLLVSIAHAESATTRERARLRQGPSAATELLGELDPGTRLELLGESAGWRQVRTPDGRTGFVWGDHIVVGRAVESTPTEPPRRPDAQPSGTRSLGDEVRDLREEVVALRQRPIPATAADVDRVRQELERVATAQRDLARRLDDRYIPGAAVPAASASDGIGTLASVLLVVGGVVGFAASRVLQRRRDHRQRNRLRL